MGPRQQPPPIGPREAGLADALSCAPSVNDVVAVLDEYAWRALAGGTRVRDICYAADRAVQMAPPSNVRFALSSLPTGLLFPFSLLAHAPPADASHTVPPHALPHLSRRQLVDALTRIAGTRVDHTTEARVVELLLEYVARRWRTGGGAAGPSTSTSYHPSGIADDVVETIARKLFEVELDVQVLAADTRSVLPTLQAFRFRLGLVSESHLVARLNLVGPAAAVFGRPLEAADVISAWAVRRLSAGVPPNVIASGLHSMHERLALVSCRQATQTVLASLALDGRSPRSSFDAGTTATTPTPSTPTATTPTPTAASTPSPTHARTSALSLSRLSFRSSKRKTMPSPLFAHRNVSVTKFLHLDSSDRRPSLPTHLAPAAAAETTPPPASRQRLGSHLSTTPQSEHSSPGVPTTPRRLGSLGQSIHSMSTTALGLVASTMSPHNASTNALGLTEAVDVRTAAVDHLLDLRYRLGPDADGWSLGSGKDKAAEFIRRLEAKGDTKDMVAELRKAFGIPGGPPAMAVPPRPPYGTTPLGTPVAAPRPMNATLHERDVSFDLDQYIADLGPMGDEDDDDVPLAMLSRKTTTAPLRYRANSIASISTVCSEASSSASTTSPRRHSTVSVGDEFIICEATRMRPPLKAVEYRFPPQYPTKDSPYLNASSVSVFSQGSGSDESTLEDLPRFPRLTKSVFNLHEGYSKVQNKFPSPSPPRFASRLRRVSGRLSHGDRSLFADSPATPTAPQMNDGSSVKLASSEYSNMSVTPPLSPATIESSDSDFGFSANGDPLSPSTATMFSPTPTLRDESITLSSPPSVAQYQRRSPRRGMYRQCVIVDGAHHSPDPVPCDRANEQPSFPYSPPEATPLTAVLALFNTAHMPQNPSEVENLLTTAVELEAQGAVARGQQFDAEARARVAWLLEQVGRELEQPELIGAVARVVGRLAGGTQQPLQQYPHQLPTPDPEKPHSPYQVHQMPVLRNKDSPRPPVRPRGDLKIVVPPRRPPRGVVVSTPSSPAQGFPSTSRYSLDYPPSANTFGHAAARAASSTRVSKGSDLRHAFDTYDFADAELTPMPASMIASPTPTPMPTPTPTGPGPALARRDAIHQMQHQRRSGGSTGSAPPTSPAAAAFPSPRPALNPSMGLTPRTAPLNLNRSTNTPPYISTSTHTTPRSTPRIVVRPLSPEHAM